MNKQMQKGFTLIELMVVIVIIGILAAIAIPSYLDNANRAKITEGINLMAPIKASVAESFIGLGVMPATPLAAGLNSQPTAYGTKLVSSITYAQSTSTTGTISVAYNDGELGAGVTPGTNMLQFVGVGTQNGVIWACKNTGETINAIVIPGAASTLPDKYKPANCRG